MGIDIYFSLKILNENQPFSKYDKQSSDFRTTMKDGPKIMLK